MKIEIAKNIYSLMPLKPKEVCFGMGLFLN